MVKDDALMYHQRLQSISYLHNGLLYLKPTKNSLQINIHRNKWPDNINIQIEEEYNLKKKEVATTGRSQNVQPELPVSLVVRSDLHAKLIQLSKEHFNIQDDKHA